MWKASKEGVELLKNWLDEYGDEDLKEKIARLTKREPMVFDYDEMLAILKPISEKFPVYKFIDRITPYVPVVEKKVNPEYEARLKRLKQEQEDREYREMTRAVDPNQIYGRDNLFHGFGQEMKAVNRQLMVIFNTLLTVAGGFSFGYFGIGYAYPSLRPDMAIRMALGLLIATAVFFADLYFIIKGLDYPGEKPIKAKKVTLIKKKTEKSQ